MNNLFSIFDPQTHSTLYLNWSSSLLVILLLPSVYWIASNPVKETLVKLSYLVNIEMNAVLGPAKSLGSSTLPLSLFLFIMLNNVLGLSPYTFTSTAHLTLAFSIALPLWIGHVLMAWVLTPNSMLAHLVPLGTPGPLMPFMVLIELISNVIRPLTLSVRLAANMVAGHLLLTLLSSSCIFSNYPILLTLILSLVALSVLESAVAMIQAYVFSILSTLYVSDIDNTSFIK